MLHKNPRMKRPQHRNLRRQFLVYCRRIMRIIVTSVPSLQMARISLWRRLEIMHWILVRRRPLRFKNLLQASSHPRNPSSKAYVHRGREVPNPWYWYNPSSSCCCSPLVHISVLRRLEASFNEFVLFNQQQNPVMVLSRLWFRLRFLIFNGALLPICKIV
jgi:hypothetical protein